MLARKFEAAVDAFPRVYVATQVWTIENGDSRDRDDVIGGNKWAGKTGARAYVRTCIMHRS